MRGPRPNHVAPLPRRALGTVLAFACAAFLVPAVHARGGPPEPDVLDADDPALRDDLDMAGRDLVRSGPSDEDVVLAAQKIRTTIQEAPSIITVVTAKQMRERGYRTINDVLRTIPGFEGDRWEANGWQKEAFARGNPQTVLILLNGVNIVEPIRNTLTLDRKIPLEMVERIEITSGPGGVLWGSNALLGVVNIVTRRPDDAGFHAVFGAGDGPGERLALKGSIGGSHRFSDDIGLYVNFDMFTTNGPELVLDQQKVIGALPEPAPDSPTLYLPFSETVAPKNRSWWFNASGRLELGPVAIDWMLPFEEEYRPIATGGSNIGRNYLTGNRDSGTDSRGSDAVRVGIISYRDRFAEDRVGLSARAYFVSWQIREDPFGVYAASALTLASQGHARDIRLALRGEDVFRPGGAVDVDWRISDTLTLLTGAELFADINEGVNQTSWAKDTFGTCPEGFTYDAFDPHLPCRIVEPQVTEDSRLTGGAFAQLDWKALPELALNAGLRLQVSSQFGSSLLWSGGAVWKMAEDTHLKLFGSSGLRPPSVVSTNVNPRTASGVSFQPNPDLVAETSQSIELEFNTTLLRDLGIIRDLFLRANGAFTVLDNVIGRPAGVYQNSDTRTIGTAEVWARLRFEAGHEIWANYAYTRVFDDGVPGGELLNFSQHVANLGMKFAFLDDRIELSGLLTWKSGMQDANRPGMLIDGRPDYSLSCAQILGGAVPASSTLYQACQFPGMQDGIWVFPGYAVMENIRPLLLLDLGVRFRNIWRDLTISMFMHNVLDHRYYEPDFFNDARVISRPQPKPGMSFFGQISIGL
jgi:outer membrane receptor protein involved in Fe transport